MSVVSGRMISNDGKQNTKTPSQSQYRRKALQTLQPLVDDRLHLVRLSPQPEKQLQKKPCVTTHGTGKDSGLTFNKLTFKAMPKENSPMVLRRSRRIQNGAQESQVTVKKAELCETKKLLVSVPEKSVAAPARKAQSKSTRKVGANKVSRHEIKVALVQNEINLSNSTVEVHDKSSVEVPDKSAVEVPDKSAVEVPKEFAYLLTGDAPESYWEEIAEQRRAALEETLRENESLLDQLAVLQAENDQLLSVVDSAEQLTSYLVENLRNDGVELGREELCSLLNTFSA